MKNFSIAIIIFLFSHISFAQFSPKQVFDNGLEAFYGARFQDGINYFNDYIKSKPDDFKGYTYRGLCYQGLKNFPRSIEDFTKVISVTPNNSDGYLNRGNSYYFSKNLTAAMQDFKDAVRLNHKDIEAFFGKSRVYLQQRRFEEALREVNLAEGVDPTNARVYINKSFVRLQMMDTVNFLNDVATAMYYDSNIVFTNYRRDLLYVKIENYKNALTLINFLLETSPNNYLLYFARGFTFFLINDFPKARKDLETSIQINKKTDPQFNAVIEQIYRSINRNSNK